MTPADTFTSSFTPSTFIAKSIDCFACLFYSITYEISEFDNLTTFETLPVKMGAVPEMQVLFPKLNTIIDTIDVEFYTPIPTM